MTCTFDREQLALLMNGDASLEERDRVAVHLSECDECRGIMAQYRAGADELAGSLAGTLPGTSADLRPGLAPIRRAAPRWGRAAVATAATVLVLVGAMQVPAVAAEVTKVLPFLEVFEMDKNGVADLIWRYSHDKVAKVYTPELFETVAAAEEAWGNPIPQPSFRPAGMDLYRIEMYRLESGEKDVYFRYHNPSNGGNLNVTLSTSARPQLRVPKGAASVTMVNGQKATVIRGTFGQYPGKQLTWEPASDIRVIFLYQGLSVEVFTAGELAETALDDLVKVAESIR